MNKYIVPKTGTSFVVRQGHLARLQPPQPHWILTYFRDYASETAFTGSVNTALQRVYPLAFLKAKAVVGVNKHWVTAIPDPDGVGFLFAFDKRGDESKEAFAMIAQELFFELDQHRPEVETQVRVALPFFRGDVTLDENLRQLAAVQVGAIMAVAQEYPHVRVQFEWTIWRHTARTSALTLILEARRTRGQLRLINET